MLYLFFYQYNLANKNALIITVCLCAIMIITAIKSLLFLRKNKNPTV